MAITPKPPTNEADTDSPELLVPANTEADITEIRGNKTIQYKGKVKSPNAPEANIETEINTSEDFSESVFNNQVEENKRFAFPQTLTEFAACLSHFAGQELYLVITRLTDAYDERYNFAAKRELQFAPVPFDAGSILFSLVDILHKLNHNSGGRFKIEVANRSGETMDDVFLVNFAVPDPMRSENPHITQSQQGENGDNNFINGLAMIMQQFQQQAALDRETMLTAIAAMKPEKDRFTALAEKKLEQDILNPPQLQSNANPILGQFAQSIEFAEMLGDIAKGRANSNDNGKNVNPYVEFLLGDERIKANVMNGALNIIGGLAKAGEGALDRAGVGQPPSVNQNTPASQQTVDAEFTDIPAQPQPQQNPAQPQASSQNIPQGTKEEMISELMAELEGDNAINMNNVFLLKTLPEKFQMQATMIFAACRGNDDFEEVFEMMETFIPAEIMARYEIPDPEEEGEKIFNDLGMKVKERLFEVYNLIRAN